MGETEDDLHDIANAVRKDSAAPAWIMLGLALLGGVTFYFTKLADMMVELATLRSRVETLVTRQDHTQVLIDSLYANDIKTQQQINQLEQRANQGRISP